MQAVKRIFRYLKSTLDFGLWYNSRRTSLSQHLQMQIVQEVMMTRKVPVEEHSF
jgi:hypothetical protein